MLVSCPIRNLLFFNRLLFIPHYVSVSQSVIIRLDLVVGKAVLKPKHSLKLFDRNCCPEKWLNLLSKYERIFPIFLVQNSFTKLFQIYSLFWNDCHSAELLQIIPCNHRKNETFKANIKTTTLNTERERAESREQRAEREQRERGRAERETAERESRERERAERESRERAEREREQREQRERAERAKRERERRERESRESRE